MLTDEEVEQKGLGHLGPCSICHHSVYRVYCLDCKELAHLGHDKKCNFHNGKHDGHNVQRKHEFFFVKTEH